MSLLLSRFRLRLQEFHGRLLIGGGKNRNLLVCKKEERVLQVCHFISN